MLSARAIATLGIGNGPRSSALLGLWPDQAEKKVENGWLGGGSYGVPNNDRPTGQALRKERERLGVIPPAVERAVEVVARIEARGQTAHEKVSDHARAELKAYLDTENEAWYNLYDELLRTAVIRIIEEQNEEQEIMMLLFEM